MNFDFSKHPPIDTPRVKMRKAAKARAFKLRCIACGRQQALKAKVECPETLHWTRTCRYCGKVYEGERGEDVR